MKIFIHTFLFLTFFAFTANMVHKVLWTEKTENCAKNDDSTDDSDDSDEDESEKKETEWFAEFYSIATEEIPSFKETKNMQFPEVQAELHNPFKSILKSPPESMC